MLVNGRLNVTNAVVAGILKPGAYNVGFTYIAGTFKLTQADGSDFSTALDERGYIVMPGTVEGEYVQLEITTSDHLFVDDTGSSDIVGEEFGTTAGVAWGNSRAFCLYATNVDDTSANLKFAISPNPTASRCPNSPNNIAYHNTPAATPSDSNFFFLTSTDVTGTHNNVACMAIGCIGMTKSASDDWTLVTGGSYNYGIGIFDLFGKAVLTFPLGQMGAAANSYFGANGPTWSNPSGVIYNYSIDMNGIVHGFVDTQTNGGNCTNGSTSSDISLYLPYGSYADGMPFGSKGKIFLNAVEYIAFLYNVYVAATTFIQLSDSTVVNGDQFANTNDDLLVSYTYRAF